MDETSARKGPGTSGERPWLARLRAIGLPVVLVAGIIVFGRVVHESYPIQKWLFWRYAEYWLCSALWAVGCVSSGHVVLKRTLGRVLPAAEHLALSFAVGVYVFFVGMVSAGLAGLYGPVLFAVLPLVMVAAGARPLLRWGRRLFRHIRAARRRGARPPSPLALPITVFGLLGVGLVYFSILTPDNVAFDSRWQHLALAEHYAAAGAARKFPEGWFIGTSPHLTSFVYTWGFMLPKSTIFDRVELSAHLEFTAFLATLVGIPALLRLIVPRLSRDRVPGEKRSLIGVSWAARFLFPGVLLYDSSLCGGADHMAAIFAVPIYTLLLRAYRDLSPRLCVLLALMLSGVFLTKYTGALTLLGFPVLAVLVRAVWLLIQSLRRREGSRAWLVGPALAFAAGLVFTAPHWVKNWIYYGDPLYPMLHRYLTLRPWTPDSSERFEWGFIKAELWRPTADLTGLKKSLGALLTFSFGPHDWPRFHGHVPVFGSLFTLLLFCLPFLRRTGRTASLFLAVHVGIFCWYWVHHQDRYLQAVLPWMAAATAAVIALAWRTHLAARLGIVGLIALQVIWGGDVYFIPGHALIGSPIEGVTRLLSSGYRKDWKLREGGYPPFSDVARALPKHAKVLVHEYRPHLGLEAMSVNDMSVNQGGISYGRMRSPREVYDLLKGYGVTHLLWGSNVAKGTDTLAADLVFFNFATKYGISPRPFGSYTLAEMPPAPPKEGGSDVVFVLACGAGFADGLYHLTDLNIPMYGPGKTKFPSPFQGDVNKGAIAPGADYAIIDVRCKRELPAAGRASFQLAATRQQVELWIRRGGT